MEYKTRVRTFTEAYVDSSGIGDIIQQEREKLLGNKDRYLSNGVIYERDYHFNGADEVRKATEEEIKLYEALVLVELYFKNLK